MKNTIKTLGLLIIIIVGSYSNSFGQLKKHTQAAEQKKQTAEEQEAQYASLESEYKVRQSNLLANFQVSERDVKSAIESLNTRSEKLLIEVQKSYPDKLEELSDQVNKSLSTIESDFTTALSATSNVSYSGHNLSSDEEKILKELFDNAELYKARVSALEEVQKKIKQAHADLSTIEAETKIQANKYDKMHTSLSSEIAKARIEVNTNELMLSNGYKNLDLHKKQFTGNFEALYGNIDQAKVDLDGAKSYIKGQEDQIRATQAQINNITSKAVYPQIEISENLLEELFKLADSASVLQQKAEIQKKTISLLNALDKELQESISEQESHKDYKVATTIPKDVQDARKVLVTAVDAFDIETVPKKKEGLKKKACEELQKCNDLERKYNIRPLTVLQNGLKCD